MSKIPDFVYPYVCPNCGEAFETDDAMQPLKNEGRCPYCGDPVSFTNLPIDYSEIELSMAPSDLKHI